MAYTDTDNYPATKIKLLGIDEEDVMQTEKLPVIIRDRVGDGEILLTLFRPEVKRELASAFTNETQIATLSFTALRSGEGVLELVKNDSGIYGPRVDGEVPAINLLREVDGVKIVIQ